MLQDNISYLTNIVKYGTDGPNRDVFRLHGAFQPQNAAHSKHIAVQPRRAVDGRSFLEQLKLLG